MQDMKLPTKIQRIVAAAVLAAATLLPATASAGGRGQKTFGIYGGYNTRNESALAGVRFTYRFSEHLRLAPSIDYTFRNNGTDAYNLSIDCHMPFSITPTQRANVYPIAGIGYSEWSHTNPMDDRERTGRLGMNIGGGVECFVTPTLRLAAEGAWRWRKDFPAGAITLSIAYVF